MRAHLRFGVIRSLGLLASLALFAANTDAADPSAAPATAEPGLIVTFQSLGKDAPPTTADARTSRLLALYVAAGDAPSDFTPAGPFRATFEGDLNLRLRDYLALSAHGRGSFTLSVNGKEVLKVSGDDLSQTSTPTLRLNKGKNHLVGVYESPTSGDAALQLFWSSKSFHGEPVPPMALSHDAADAPLLASSKLRQGRLLFADFRCAKCHATPAAADTHAMPELTQDTPSLQDVGALLQAGWIATWVNNPRASRADAHMPRLFQTGDGSQPDPRAADVAAYLATLGKPSDDAAPSSDTKTIEGGGRLFAHLNCVACHTPPDAAADADPTRVPLRQVAAKFRATALVAYLKQPEAHYAWNPMPNFKLSAEEAGALSAWLLSVAPADNKASAGDATRGKELVRTSGCLNCHAMTEPSALTAAPLAELTGARLSQGCLAADGATRKAAPDFAFTLEQREAIGAFAATNRTSLARRTATEFASRQVTLLRCAACHARDDRESLLATSLDAEANALKTKYAPVDVPNQPLAADQRPPLLTWAGEKLRTEWAAAFIGGRLTYKPRPYLRARMPAFASRAEVLASGLAGQHGCASTDAPYPHADPDLAVTGQKLTGTTPNQGFSCVQCHAVANQAPKAPFEAPSINFMYVTERLRKDYYARWIHDPLRVDPNTKMPRFDDADDKTGIRDIFDGDAPKQFEAIWQYLLTGKDIQPAP